MDENETYFHKTSIPNGLLEVGLLRSETYVPMCVYVLYT
jgi:hypothetical protein